MKRIREKWAVTLLLPVIVGIVCCFLLAVQHLEDGRRAEGKAELEDALRRAAVACYAAEGIYPPNLEYMEEHYGIRIDEGRYTVMYVPIASNLMPDITVLEASAAYEE